MGFLKKLFFGRKKEYEEQNYDEESGQFDREVINMRDKEERLRYVDNCLEQIAEASGELDQLTEEYNLVTTYLTDMEEIEALPEPDREQLRQQAQKIVELSQSRENYLSRKDRMKERKVIASSKRRRITRCWCARICRDWIVNGIPVSSSRSSGGLRWKTPEEWPLSVWWQWRSA